MSNQLKKKVGLGFSLISIVMLLIIFINPEIMYTEKMALGAEMEFWIIRSVVYVAFALIVFIIGLILLSGERE